MKTIATNLFLLIFLGLPVFSQSDKVLGFWLTAEGDSQLEIFKTNEGRYSGKVVWIDKDWDAKDDKNPNPKLQSRKIVGLQFLSNFRFNEKDKEWVDGSIYDPKNGKTYDCYMWFDNDKNLLNIKGFVLGMHFLGRQTSWKRENKIREPISTNKQLKKK